MGAYDPISNDTINFANSAFIIYLTEGGKKMVAERNWDGGFLSIKQDDEKFDYLKDKHNLTDKDI